MYVEPFGIYGKPNQRKWGNGQGNTDRSHEDQIAFGRSSKTMIHHRCKRSTGIYEISKADEGERKVDEKDGQDGDVESLEFRLRDK